MMRDAGYIDAWPFLHQSAEGFTGMWNRVGCGVPEGYLWKRIDYAWSRYTTPLSMTRFGMYRQGRAPLRITPASSRNIGFPDACVLPGGRRPLRASRDSIRYRRAGSELAAISR